ncbi:hypothetical protein DB346_24320 [Verrucomicrobia bacterium LW23]|nr:hypothetical protein DB346_24320 [Verrucomicrobia bacterium LW23]
MAQTGAGIPQQGAAFLTLGCDLQNQHPSAKVRKTIRMVKQLCISVSIVFIWHRKPFESFQIASPIILEIVVPITNTIDHS